MSAAWIILGAVLAQRLAELVYAGRNTRRLLAKGGREFGAGHYPLFALLHGTWLAAQALWLIFAGLENVVWPLVAVYGALQIFRAWILFSLGERWTTRVIVLPNAPLVRAGPYRFIKHPNYWLVCAEIAVLPLIFGAWPVALVFSFLNGALLFHRIPIENAALKRLQ
ncbi:MAG: isoprenylcysteine carboxylmethyltransferase family protein [Alphaproteobacteria bacterium]